MDPPPCRIRKTPSPRLAPKPSYGILYTEFNAMPAPLLRLDNQPDLVDRVYRALLDAISDGSLAPGQRLTQEELAEQLAVSRQPIIQALRLLKKDGFVQEAPALHGPTGRSRGVQVAFIDAAWIGQVYQVRSALDALAARLAAQRRTRIDPSLIRAGRDAVRRSDIRAMIDADLAFHTALYRGSGNPLIEQSALLHWQHIRRAMGEALQTTLSREPVWDEHETIAQAVACGDPDEAERLMRFHGDSASHRLAHQLSATDRPTPGAMPHQLRGSRAPGPA